MWDRHPIIGKSGLEFILNEAVSTKEDMVCCIAVVSG